VSSVYTTPDKVMVISEAGNYMARRQRQVCVSDFSTAVFDNTVGV